jgi:hypothetical protein
MSDGIIGAIDAALDDFTVSEDAARWVPPGAVPHHEHITVDEETYWGLMYLHHEVQRMFTDGELTDGALKYLSDEAERRLQQSRKWNALDPNHAAVVTP